jgi:integrase
MSTVASRPERRDDLLDAYADHCAAVGLGSFERADRLTIATKFLTDHRDLDTWMTRALPVRLTDLERCPLAWPLVGFAVLSGRTRADFDLLAAKHAGRSFARAAEAIYPREFAELREAAGRLDWAELWTTTVLRRGLPLAIAASGGCSPVKLTQADIDRVRDAVRASPYTTPTMRRAKLSYLHSLARLLYEAHVLPAPPIHRRGDGPGNFESRLAVVGAPEIRRVMLAYVQAKQAQVKVSSIRNLTSHLAAFGEFLTSNYPSLASLSVLRREHVEAYCVFVPTRRWRGQRACDNQIGSSSVIAGLVAVRGFLDDIAAWGWSAAPARRLMFAADVPRPPQQLPRALAPGTDAALMAAVADLPDLFARVSLMVLRGTGLRMGELLDLELDCVVDYGPSGHWLRVPLGKLNSERSIPLDEATLDVLTQWTAQRGTQRALPHQQDGRMVDFLFVEHGRRPKHSRIARGLADAVRAAGLTGADGEPLHVTAHQLRHCYATALANSGMSIQGLMALLGHTTPEMTLRYATLASPTLRAAYETAMGRMRPRLPIAPVGKPMVPDRVQWLNAEVLKTRVAHGFCSRELAAEACAYANICETCENFLPATEFTPSLQDQLADIRALREDAAARGWTSEIARHQRVIDSLETHLRRLQTNDTSTPNP